MLPISVVPAVLLRRVTGHSVAVQLTKLAFRWGQVCLYPLHIVRARRDFELIARMSDHELRDIGLTRQDLRNATALPLHEDPTRFLAAAAARRRGRTARR